jgi:hypothetical protein
MHASLLAEQETIEYVNVPDSDPEYEAEYQRLRAGGEA